jgi:hypothetical protein
VQRCIATGEVNGRVVLAIGAQAPLCIQEICGDFNVKDCINSRSGRTS